MSDPTDSVQTSSEMARPFMPEEYWEAFDQWMRQTGCANRGEGFRCLMQAVVDQEQKKEAIRAYWEKQDDSGINPES